MFLGGAEFCGRCSSIAAALRHREPVFLFLVLLWIFHTAVCSWALSERKGTIINCALPHRPTSHYVPSLPPSFYTYKSLYPCLSILTHTGFSFFFFFSIPGSQCPSLNPLSLLTPSPFFPVRAAMGLKNVCDVIQTDCSSVSGMPLPPLPPLLPDAPPPLHPPPPTSILQSLFRHKEVSPLCLAGSAALVLHLLIEDVCCICLIFSRPGPFDTCLVFTESGQITSAYFFFWGVGSAIRKHKVVNISSRSHRSVSQWHLAVFSLSFLGQKG